MSEVDMQLRCSRYELDFGMHDGEQLAGFYSNPRGFKYSYLIWVKKERIHKQNPALGEAIEEFEKTYFPKPKDYKFTYGEYIGKTFPDVPDTYVRRLKKWPETEVHPGLAAALEY